MSSAITSASAAPSALATMARSSRRLGLKMPGVSTSNLRVALDGDAAQPRPRGLHLVGDDGDLGADELIDQRRCPHSAR
jgi:hypothetical protein